MVYQPEEFPLIRLAALLFVALVAAQSASAQTAPEIVRDCPTCPEMVRIKAGSFTMGISEAETALVGFQLADKYSRPQHRVTFAHDFWLGRYPVTRGEFAEFVKKTSYEATADCYGRVIFQTNVSWNSVEFPQTDRDPVVCVNVADAEAYAAWLSKQTGKPYRLPTESEWEYAARAGTTTAFYWGDAIADVCRHANVSDLCLRRVVPDGPPLVQCDDGYPYTAPVGGFPANPWGLFGMAGNVWQLTADCYAEDYTGAPSDGSAWKGRGTDCAGRMGRGGSWAHLPQLVRPGVRGGVELGRRSGDIGFRLAKSDPAPASLPLQR